MQWGGRTKVAGVDRWEAAERARRKSDWSVVLDRYAEADAEIQSYSQFC